jgi:hypothetical protein
MATVPPPLAPLWLCNSNELLPVKTPDALLITPENPVKSERPV